MSVNKPEKGELNREWAAPDRGKGSDEEEGQDLDLTIIEEKKYPETVIIETGHKRGKKGFLLRTRRVRLDYAIDVKKTIENALRNLEELAEEAHRRATSKYQPTDARQKWARIEAYIYQTINSLAKTHDGLNAMEKLEELTRRVEELMEEDPEPREED